MNARFLIIIGIVVTSAIVASAIGTIYYQSEYNQNCNSDGGYVVGFLRCTYIHEDFADPRITGKMAREICSITGGECPPNYIANPQEDGSKTVGVTISDTVQEKSFVFTIRDDTLSYQVTETDFDLSQIRSMKPNSMEFFYYPNPEDTKNRDVFQMFILIRLPESIGGGIDDVSAFRAYSALSVSNHCMMKYWPDEGRKRMEDPCWGSMYRPIDGLMMTGGKPVTNNVPVALPYLDLSIDEGGSLYVEPPVWAPRENGVIGVGRDISIEEIRLGSQTIVDSYRKTNPNHPDLPVNFAGQILTQIYPDSDRVEVLYRDFSSTDWKGISFYISNVSAQEQTYFFTLAKSNSEFWQIGDDVIWIGGSALDKDSEINEGFKEHEIRFVLDGFKFTIIGKNLEFMKKAIVANYFPEFEYADLFLVSSTVEE